MNYRYKYIKWRLILLLDKVTGDRFFPITVVILCIVIITSLGLFVISSFNSDENDVIVDKGNNDNVSVQVQNELSSVGRIRTLSFNVRGNECWGKEELIAQYLFDNQVDVFGMQENHCNVAQIAQLWQDKLQASESPKKTRVTYVDPTKNRFSAVFTRLKVVDEILNQQDIANVAKPLIAKDDDSKPVIGIKVDFNDAKVVVYNLHSNCSEIEDGVKKQISNSDVPYLFMGDFNCSSRTLMKMLNSWMVQSHDITCFNPASPDSYLDDARCGGSTKGINRMVTFTPPEEGRKYKDTGEPHGSGPIDHHAVLKEIRNGTQLKLTDNFRVVREERVKFSDHWPIIADVEVLSGSGGNDTEGNTIQKVSCAGFSVYDREKIFPDVINNSHIKKVNRSLDEQITIRAAAKGDVRSTDICWTIDGLNKYEYHYQKNWVCVTVCAESDTDSPSSCDNPSIHSGHITGTVLSFIEKFSTDEVKSLAKSNGLLFVLNIHDKEGGLCSGNPAYTDTGVYFDPSTNFTDGKIADKYDSNTRCAQTAEGMNCIRKIGVQNNLIDLNLDKKTSIEDFVEFARYYHSGDCAIDLDRDNNCKEIDDFQMFISRYKKQQQ